MKALILEGITAARKTATIVKAVIPSYRNCRARSRGNTSLGRSNGNAMLWMQVLLTEVLLLYYN